MARSRSPDREKAFELWKQSGGKMQLKDIAALLRVSPSQVRNWKAKDQWEDVSAMIAQLNTNDCATKRTQPKIGAPKGNKNAVGNRGGPGGPAGNDKAVKHGFFRRIFPDDEETHAILDEIVIKSPIDILWDNIQIQYLAIARAQKIMFVQDNEDHSDFQTKSAYGDTFNEVQMERQWSWDKHAKFLQAQSRAISTLEGLISRYEEMLQLELKNEEKRLRLEKLKADIAKVKGDDGPTEDDGFIDALKAEGGEVWSDDESGSET